MLLIYRQQMTSLRSSERGLKSVDGRQEIVCGKSLRSSERGLKCQYLFPHRVIYMVAPFVGAWIEIYRYVYIYDIHTVAPFVGAWIEISPLSATPRIK